MKWALVDVGCIECGSGEDTVVVSLHETQEEAKAALEAERARLGIAFHWQDGYFDGGQHEIHVCPVGRGTSA